MSRRAPRRDPAWLGIAGALVVAAIVYGVFAKRVPFHHPWQIKAVVTSSNQLRKGSPVRIAGVDVGKVAAIDHGPGHTTEVTLEVPKGDGLLHRDATLRIRPRLFLEGGFYVDLRPGSPSAPRMGEDDVIPLGQTAIPVQFNDVLDTLDRPTRSSLRSVVARFSAALGKGGAEAFGRAAKPSVAAERDAAIITRASLGTRPHDLSALVGALGRVTAALGSGDAQLGRLLDGVQRTSAALAAEDRPLAASIPATDRLLADAPATLTAVDRALPPATRLANAIRPGLRAAPAALRRASGLLAELEALTRADRLPRLVTRLQPTVRVLPSTERRLRGLFALVTPVSDCIRDRAVPVLNTKLDDGTLSTGKAIWQDLASGSVGLGSASASFDANGTFIRYLESLGADSVSLENIPGAGKVIAKGVPTKLRVRPRPLAVGTVPAFRPDQTCRDQAAPDMQTPDVTIHTFDDAATKRSGPAWTPQAIARLVQSLQRTVARERAR